MRFPVNSLCAALAVLGSAALVSETAGQFLPDAIQPSTTTVRLKIISDELVAPNLLQGASDGSGRRFVVDQPGQVYIVEAGGNRLPTPFIDVSSNIATLRNAFSGQNPGTGLNGGFDERGLLGLAFHPDFANLGSPGYHKVYTYHSEDDAGMTPDFSTIVGTPNHHSVVSEWTVDAVNPNVVDPTSRRTLLRVAEPQFNHNAGMLAFDPNGNLLIAFGDGGNANDVGAGHTPDIGNGQDRTNPLGSLLRIDPLGNSSANGQYGIPVDNPFVGNSDGFVEEIFSWGLRNPFRYSLDGNDIVIADVGQNQIEEVNHVSLATASGANFGWHYKEGSFYFDPNSPSNISEDPIPGVTPDGFSSIEPVLQYDHSDGISVIGGFVYRGSALPNLFGKYIFGEFIGRLFAGDLDDGTIEELNVIGDLGSGVYSDLGMNIKGFGVDDDGELYILSGVNQGPSDTLSLAIKIVPVSEPTSSALAGLSILGLLAARRRKRIL
jgi:MYXO-CTERM domain-containing protein